MLATRRRVAWFLLGFAAAGANSNDLSALPNGLEIERDLSAGLRADGTWGLGQAEMAQVRVGSRLDRVAPVNVMASVVPTPG